MDVFKFLSIFCPVKSQGASSAPLPVRHKSKTFDHDRSKMLQFSRIGNSISRTRTISLLVFPPSSSIISKSNANQRIRAVQYVYTVQGGSLCERVFPFKTRGDGKRRRQSEKRVRWRGKRVDLGRLSSAGPSSPRDTCRFRWRGGFAGADRFLSPRS